MRKALIRFWRELNSEPTLTVSVVTLTMAAMMAVGFAAIACIHHGVNGNAIDALIDEWWIFAFILSIGVLWLIFYHAGIDPERGFDRLFLAGAIGTIGYTVGLFMGLPHTELSPRHQRDAQRDFHKAIMSATMPCVTSQDKLSDLSACTVFGLRPGMIQGEALGIVDGSGYFPTKEKPAVCKTGDKCSQYVSFIKDGLYLRVEFNGDPKSAAPDLRVSKIVLSLNEGANPYFDENQMLAAFLKLIGPNGTPNDTTRIVWIDIKNALELSAYTHERTFWAVFSSRLADHADPPGVPV